MTVEYRLTLAGDTPIADVAARVLPDAADRIEPYGPGLTADLADHGLSLTIRSRADAYLEGEADDPTTPWIWEPSPCIHITCHLAADPDLRETGTHIVLDIVGRVLSTGTEDAALMLNSDYLLLTRVGGVVTKHRRSVWWDHYGWPNEVLLG
jgi:hypothetical protein